MIKSTTRLLATTLALSTAFLMATAEASAIDVPRLEGIVVDGKPDDWRGAGFQIEAMAAADGRVRAAADLDSRITLGWDDRGLLVLAQVQDQDFVEAADTNQLYAGDSLELYLIDKPGGANMIQAVIAPGMTATQTEARCRLYDYRKDPALKAQPPAITVARTKVAGGYILEALIPWSNMGLSARPGAEAAVQIFVNDIDAGVRPLTLAWYPATGTFMNTERACRIRLAAKASPLAHGVAHAFTLGSNYWFSVITLPRQVGKSVTVSFEGKKVAEGTISEFAGRAGACLNALLPPDRLNTGRFEVTIDGQALEPVAAADLEQERGESAFPVRYRMPETFTGDKLQAGEFADAAAVQKLVGPFDTKVTIFNESFAKVTAPTGPGLYGAIVEVQPRLFQPPLHRFFTFARPADDAGTKPGNMDTNLWSYAMRRQAGLATTLKYWLELPQKVDKVPANGWPLFVLLHGAGERGKTPQHFKGWAGYPRGAKPDTFIIAVPACPKDTTWSVAQLDDMISDLTARYPVDTNRIYIAGHSMGGGGSWKMLAAFPDRFAGAIVCAAAMATLSDEDIERIRNVPVWIFHGARDDAAPVAAAREMVARLERVHGRFRYTENAEDDHGTILGKAFGPVEVYDWLLQQVCGEPTQPPAAGDLKSFMKQ